MAKAFYIIVAAVLLCIFSAATVLLCPLYAATSMPHASSKSYKEYIVYIQTPPPEADIMDNGARNSWFQSFLPSNLTDSGKPCMVTTFDTIIHDFVAWLTEAELEVMSKKPGVSRWTEVEMMELTQTPRIPTDAAAGHGRVNRMEGRVEESDDLAGIGSSGWPFLRDGAVLFFPDRDWCRHGRIMDFVCVPSVPL
ncbi:unnamed protein product [Triticum turgidum subsp. durum]|uniref:Inhibitor I9 domain-containing protein n=1 Tax=Triticum turgidum subsp. durum TaxID=4567 RepID=A0A9R1NKK4_TRITD|nr:unnamed protein product [Triticum turgidum subsp. durum]